MYAHTKTANTWINKQWLKLFKGALKSKISHLKRFEVTGQEEVIFPSAMMKLWNSLPDELIDARIFDEFKNLLTKFINSFNFYTILKIEVCAVITIKI